MPLPLATLDEQSKRDPFSAEAGGTVLHSGAVGDTRWLTGQRYVGSESGTEIAEPARSPITSVPPRDKARTL